jgi:hypothetical protein
VNAAKRGRAGLAAALAMAGEKKPEGGNEISAIL